MRGRFVTAAMIAAVLVAGSSGCFLRTEKVPQKTARITVNNVTRSSHAVSCTQVQWLLTADIGAAPAHVRVVVRLDRDKPTPESVDIDNFEGFTGVANAAVGNAKAVVAGDTYTITGEAQGTDPSNPATPATANFKIEVGC